MKACESDTTNPGSENNAPTLNHDSLRVIVPMVGILEEIAGGVTESLESMRMRMTNPEVEKQT